MFRGFSSDNSAWASSVRKLPSQFSRKFSDALNTVGVSNGSLPPDAGASGPLAKDRSTGLVPLALVGSAMVRTGKKTAGDSGPSTPRRAWLHQPAADLMPPRDRRDGGATLLSLRHDPELFLQPPTASPFNRGSPSGSMPLILATLLQATFRSNPRSRRQGGSPRVDTQGTAVISLDFSSVAYYPSTIRWSAAQAETRCRGLRPFRLP